MQEVAEAGDGTRSYFPMYPKTCAEFLSLEIWCCSDTEGHQQLEHALAKMLLATATMEDAVRPSAAASITTYCHHSNEAGCGQMTRVCHHSACPDNLQHQPLSYSLNRQIHPQRAPK